jgi:hypothetical protein
MSTCSLSGNTLTSTSDIIFNPVLVGQPPAYGTGIHIKGVSGPTYYISSNNNLVIESGGTISLGVVNSATYGSFSTPGNNNLLITPGTSGGIINGSIQFEGAGPQNSISVAVGNGYLATANLSLYYDQTVNNGSVIINTPNQLTLQTNNSIYLNAGENINLNTTLSWTQSSVPYSTWRSICSSSSGQYLAACNVNGTIYTSSNYGGTWAQSSAPNTQWSDICSSSSGQFLAACPIGGYIITSSDYGGTWTPSSTPYNLWQTICSSSSGQYLAAGVYSDNGVGGIYTSSDYGGTWTQSSAPKNKWWDICSSSSGQILAACIYSDNSGIYTSSDYGGLWVQTSAPNKQWLAICSSSSGQILAAGVYNGGIYMSFDYGGTWALSNAPNNRWTSICSSSSGQFLAACVFTDNGGIYTSSDYGGTWAVSNMQNNLWYSICSSSSGQFLAASQLLDASVIDSGGIYVYIPQSSISTNYSNALINTNSIINGISLQSIFTGYNIKVVDFPGTSGYLGINTIIVPVSQLGFSVILYANFVMIYGNDNLYSIGLKSISSSTLIFGMYPTHIEGTGFGGYVYVYGIV